MSKQVSNNSTGGTTRPVKARSISPTEETSRPVLTEGGPGDPSQDKHMTTGRINQVAFIYQGKTTSYSRKHMESGNRRRLERHLLSGDKHA
ncbi:hypothetical protein YC2023_066239 [Brassica napus]